MRDRPGETHLCPPQGTGVMPCCERTPFDVPETDRVTPSADRVTCSGSRAPEQPPQPCGCAPICTVQDVLWAYSRELGWHDPRNHPSRAAGGS